ncbi:response regulator [Silvimonas sp. JCM 19000]
MARILIIEDNAANLKLFTFLLKNAGHTVSTATEAATGLSLARAELPDLILMDVQLPGMDGLEATRLLKADSTTGHIKVVVVTAFAMKGDEARMLAAGCDGYVAKPIHYADFLEKVNTALA